MARSSTRTPPHPKPKSAPAKPTRVERANALVDAGRRAEDARAKRGRILVADIRKRMRAVGAEFLAIGRGFKTIVDDVLYRALGYDTFDALLEGEKLGSHTQAFKLMAVAAVFGRIGIDDFGVERAAALIAYARATPGDDDAAELLETNAQIGAKRVRDSTVQDLMKATRDVQAAAAAKVSPEAAGAARAAREKAALKRVAAGHKAGKLPAAELTVVARHVVARWPLEALSPKSVD